MAENEPLPLDDEEEAATRGGLGDLLGALLGGGADRPSNPPAGPDLGGIGGLLGGGGGLPGIPDEEEPTGAGQGGLDLGSLLGGLMAGGQQQGNAAPAGGLDIGALLGTLLGGGQALTGASSPASAALMQALVPLLMGALFKKSGGRALGVRATAISDPETDAAVDDMADLLNQARTGAVPDDDALRASPAAQLLARQAGIDVPAAIKALQQLLAALQGNQAKPRPRPSASSRPKPKPASAGSKPKPSTATSKPKPKPASATSKPKPKPSETGKPKPKPKPAAKPAGSTKPKTSGKRPAAGNKRSTGGG